MEPFKVFTQEVFEDYQAKKGTKNLATELEDPAGAKLRERCLIILADLQRKKDHEVIKEFFDPRKQFDDLEVRIKKADTPDMLKPLANFMKCKVRKTEVKNIKLLAALIDFEPRPYEEWRVLYLERKAKESTKGKGEETNIGGQKTDGETSPRKDEGTTKKPRKWITAKIKLGAAVVGTTLALLIAIYVIAGKPHPSSCMIWNEDHYLRTRCEPRKDNVSVLAYDEAKVKHFRKINDESTITYNSIGTLWYSKIDNEIEFFTKSGTHPVHHKKTLKPVTMHIIDTYVKNVNKRKKEAN